MKKGYFITAAAFAAVALFVIWEASSFPGGRKNVPGPAFYPTAVAVLMLISAISLFISGVRMTPEENLPLGLLSSDVKRVYASMLCMAVYVVSMYYVGFFTTSAAMLFGFIRWFGKYRFHVCALWAVGISGVVFLTFKHILHVSLRFGALL